MVEDMVREVLDLAMQQASGAGAWEAASTSTEGTVNGASHQPCPQGGIWWPQEVSGSSDSIDLNSISYNLSPSSTQMVMEPEQEWEELVAGWMDMVERVESATDEEDLEDDLV